MPDDLYAPEGPPLTRDQVLRRAIRNRAERLIKFIDLAASDYVVGMESWLIMRGAMGLGEQATKAMTRDLIEGARNGMAFCTEDNCNEGVNPALTHHLMCKTHQGESDKLVDDLLSEVPDA